MSPVGVASILYVDMKFKEIEVDYYFTKTIDTEFDEAIEKVTSSLKERGFGVLTEIDMKATFKKKLDVDFYNYKILGACQPHFAYKAVQAEDKIGVMLPCNVIIQQKTEGGPVQVSAVDPAASMMAIENSALGDIAGEVRGQLKEMINQL
jgi:uncharacterized protein (DUF302 family)